MLRSLMLLTLASAVGCGGLEAKTGPVRLEPQPASERFVQVATEAWGENVTRFEADVALGLGEGYAPEVAAMVVPAFGVTPADCFAYGGTFVLRQASSSSDLVGASIVGEALVLEPRRAGVTTVTVEGTYQRDHQDPGCPFSSGEAVAVVVELAVAVYDAPRVAFFSDVAPPSHDFGQAPPPPAIACRPTDDAPALAQAGARLSRIDATVVDETGRPIELLNADPSHQWGGVVYGLDQAATRFDGLVMPEAGTVVVEPDHGEVLEIDTVPPSAIEGVSFFVQGRQGSLEAGQSYDLGPDAHEVTVSVATPWAQGVTLCSLPRAEDYEVRSSTPEVCTTRRSPYDIHSKTAKGEAVLRDVTVVHRAGECGLELAGPSAVEEQFPFVATSVDGNGR